MSDKKRGSTLTGTTLRVYRYLYRNGRALGVRDIQRGLGLSSPSVADYHVKKLLEMGLVKESDSHFIVDRVVFENMIRIKTSLIPLQVAYSVAFGVALLLLVFLFRPQTASGQFIFSVIMMGLACGIFAYQAFRNLKAKTI
ncbi:MAG: winged helix-turn-helix domain-containing protein [Nitrososphaerales archaeon]